MSDECCGVDESRRPSAQGRRASLQLIGASSAKPSSDACCGGDEAVAVVHDERDACCGPDPARRLAESGEEPEVRPPWWRDIALLPSAVSGLFLVAGYAVDWSGPGVAALVAQWIALLAGAWTFVPGAVRRLIRGRLGVGLLMTIAAVGAVLLGHVAEAAALAFLFSLAEALEDRAMDRA